MSHFQLSQFAVGEAQPDSAACAHLASCSACAMRLNREGGAVMRGRHEILPARIKSQFATSETSATTWRVGLGMLATCAGLMISLWLQPQPVSHAFDDGIKGAPALLVSARRDGNLVLDSVALEKARDLRAGDELRVAVTGTSAARIRLEGWEDNGWVEYFDGPRPDDGWLPTGMQLTAGARARLRVSACTTDLQECQEHTYDLEEIR